MEKGFVQVYCGAGKGKTTAAIGQGIRAIGGQYKVIMIQFLKTPHTGECSILKNLEPYFKVFHFEKDHDFTWMLNEEEKEELKSETQNALNFANKVMDTRECDMLILDEILNSLQQNLLTEIELCNLIDNKPEDMELVLTGRLLPGCIAERADYISLIEAVKHPMGKGIEARKGIEY
jgi:cob(I)alamin adenosyltransferase